MEKQRQPHADLIIMQANNTSLRFDYKNKNMEWELVLIQPCVFHPHNEYRLHEREFPKTSLSRSKLLEIYYACNGLSDSAESVANAAIKQYILDNEKESK